MILLLQSALRALLLGACVWGLLRLLKLRDPRSETAAWTLVLAASLAMPLLTPLLERWLPGAPLPAPLAPVRELGGLPLPHTGIDWRLPFWAGYGLGVAVMLGRLVAGLILSLRLYRRTVPLADAPRLRIGAGVRGPMVFGRCILLPGNWHDWPEALQAAVLAHEQRHLARGDFFLQLAANLYRAFFWFSPFAWWLQRQLSALGERDSDAAAVRRMGDRAGYAELLVAAARHAQGLPALVAMATGPDVAWRLDHILTDTGSERTPGAARQALAAALLLIASLGVAGAHATPTVVPPAIPALPVADAAPLAPVRLSASPPPPPVYRRHRKTVSPPPAAEAAHYNPRALLDAPVAVVRPVLLLTGR